MEFFAIADVATDPKTLQGLTVRKVDKFILEPCMSTPEANRFAELGVTLESGKDLLFPPSILDEYQNTGLASLTMPHLIEAARRGGARRLVLMGGTQESNTRAIGFYEKSGFKRFGGCQTGIFNHDMRLILAGGFLA